MSKKSDRPVLFEEEYSKPWFFHNASVSDLHQQLSNAPPRSVVVRNHDKWPSSSTDINRLKLECSFLQDLNGGIEQYVVVKERKERIKELPSDDDRDLDAAKADANTPKFSYYFDNAPKEKFDEFERLLDSVGLKPLMAHHWETTAFRRPTTCAQCSKFIWGLTGKTGHQCRVCQKPAHSRCYTLMPPRCAGTAMTKDERQDRAVRKVWSNMDADGNGSITFTELVNHMGMSPDEAALFIKAFDKDKNARIDYDEFKSLVLKYFVKTFRQFDRNDDGEITPQELKEGFKDLGMNMSNAELLKYMSEMDADDDGVITLDEYVEACFITIALKSAEEELNER